MTKVESVAELHVVFKKHHMRVTHINSVGKGRGEEAQLRFSLHVVGPLLSSLFLVFFLHFVPPHYFRPVEKKILL